MVLNSCVRNSSGGDLLEGRDGRTDILSPSPIQTGNEKGAKRKERWRPKEGENPWISDLDKDARQQPRLTRGPSAVLRTLKREVNCTYNLISDMNPRSLLY